MYGSTVCEYLATEAKDLGGLLMLQEITSHISQQTKSCSCVSKYKYKSGTQVLLFCNFSTVLHVACNV